MSGYKSIAAGVAGILIGIAGLTFNLMSPAAAGGYILGGMTAIFLRLGIKTGIGGN